MTAFLTPDAAWWRFAAALAALTWTYGLTAAAGDVVSPADFPLIALAAYVVADLTEATPADAT